MSRWTPMLIGSVFVTIFCMPASGISLIVHATPANPTAADRVTVTTSWVADPCYAQPVAGYRIVGAEILVDVSTTRPPLVCVQIAWDYSASVEVGPLVPGDYTIRAGLIVNGGLTSTAEQRLFVTSASETILRPFATGPTVGTIGMSYSFSANGASSTLAHPLQYLFDWGDGSNSGWLSAGSDAASHSWAAEGAYSVRAQARCASAVATVSAWSVPSVITISTFELVSVPNPPHGRMCVLPCPPEPGVSYSVSTGNASSSLGHPIQYMIDWGDGTNSGWLAPGVTNAAHVWGAGSYFVRAQARCATDTAVVSGWSAPNWVTVTPIADSKNPLLFVPVAPCRVADTRAATGKTGYTGVRDFPIAGVCGIPSSAHAYSLNVSTIPRSASLGFLAIWPAGVPQPLVSTLNSYDGRVKANAAIVGAGANGAVSVYVSDPADVFMDISGYFVPLGTVPGALAFYLIPPCRVSDTRWPPGPFGAPPLAGGVPREVPLHLQPCSIAPSARAYALNLTVIPRTARFSFLSTWPAVWNPVEGEHRSGVKPNSIPD